jgi:hypothetical protein
MLSPHPTNMTGQDENVYPAGHRILNPVTLSTQEAEVVRIAVGGQPGQKVHETLSRPIKLSMGA